MATEWLLISTFGGAEPSIIGVGSRPKQFVPLSQHFSARRGPNKALEEAQSVVVELIGNPVPIDRISNDGRIRIVAKPLLNSAGRLHGIYLWRGAADETVPPRDPAGAWHFNLTQGKASGSEDLFDLYGVSEEDRRSEVAQAGAFTRLKTNADEGEALAKIVTSAPGTEHQAVWTVRRDDGQERAAHFSCRMLEERPDPASDRTEVILRGVTQDIGPANEVPTAPPPVILEHRVLEAKIRPGEYLAYVDIKRLKLIKWHRDPRPGIAWESVVGEPEPAMHPEDVSIARQMSKDLARGATSGVLRFRGVDGAWKPLHLEVCLMAFDQHTTGGLVTVTEVPAE